MLTLHPASPEMVAAFEKIGQTVIEVTVKRYYVLNTEADLTSLMQEWFVKFRGRSHAYRDGSHIGGGGDMVQEIRNVTTDKIITL